MGNGTVTAHRQIAACHLGARADQIDIINADTDLTPYDSGTFASTGTVVAGQAVGLTAQALRDNILDYAARKTGTDSSAWRLEHDSVVSGNNRISLVDLHAAGIKAGHRFEAKRKAYLSPRTVAFNVHGIRLAVHRMTGEIRRSFGEGRASVSGGVYYRRVSLQDRFFYLNGLHQSGWLTSAWWKMDQHSRVFFDYNLDNDFFLLRPDLKNSRAFHVGVTWKY